MEHSCSKCGAVVVDGTPFCPQCKNPQIRVAGFEPEAHSDHGSDHSLTTGEQGPATGIPRQIPHAMPRAVQWHQALPAAAIGGVISIFGLIMPLVIWGPSCPVIVWGPAYALGSAAAVFIYSLRTRNRRLLPSTGAKIGAASAGFGFSIAAILSVGAYVYHSDELLKAITDAYTQLAANGADPKATQQVLELLKTPEGLGIFVAFFLTTLLVIFVLISSLGGALCASWLRRH